MNLGLLDAAALATALIQDRRNRPGPLLAYQRQRRRAVSTAATQAEFNLFWPPTSTPELREQALRRWLSRPVRPLMARLFTRRWL